MSANGDLAKKRQGTKAAAFNTFEITKEQHRPENDGHRKKRTGNTPPNEDGIPASNMDKMKTETLATSGEIGTNRMMLRAAAFGSMSFPMAEKIKIVEINSLTARLILSRFDV